MDGYFETDHSTGYVQRKKKRKDFETTYSKDRGFLGTVVHVAPDYALVQPPEGVTGIIHVTAIKAHPRDYLDVHEVLTEGETIRVRVVKMNAESRRVELSLIRQ